MPDLENFLGVNPEPATSEPVTTGETVAETPAAPAVEAAPAAPPAAETHHSKEQPRNEHGQFVPREALIAERRQRQELQRQLEEQQRKPDFWANPEEAVTHAVKSEVAEVRQEFADRFYNAVESAARARYADYDQVREVFLETAQGNPVLAKALAEAPDPAEYVYRTGTQIRELRDIGGDISAYKAKVTSTYEQKIKELESKVAELSKGSVPRSLNAEPSAASQSPGAWQPAPLGSILGHKF